MKKTIKNSLSFEKVEKTFFQYLLKEHPELATHLGVHTYDHLLSDVSKKSILHEITLLKQFKKQFALCKKQKLSFDQRLDCNLAVAMIEGWIFSTQTLRFWEKDPDCSEALGDSLFLLFLRDFAPFEKRLRAIIARLHQFPRYIMQTQERVTSPVALWTRIAIESCQTLPLLFSEIKKETLRQKCSAKLNKELASAITLAENAIKEYQLHLQKKMLPVASKQYAIGTLSFEQLLQKRNLCITKKQLLVLGKNALAHYTKELRRVAKVIDSSKKTLDVLHRVEQEHPRSFQEAFANYTTAINTARTFVQTRNVATVPSSESLISIETPGYARQLIPFAAYMQQPRFEKNGHGTYLITPPKSKEGLMHHNKFDIRNVSVHEAYPGHHLQFACAMKNKSLIRCVVDSDEYVEGWAHYCEEYMYQQGFHTTPKHELVFFKDALWRACRVIIDVKLSCGEMSFDEAVLFLQTHVGMKKEDATGEVKRYTKSPGYQIGYYLGKYRFQQLRKQYAQLSDKEFHDTILYSGVMPIMFLKKIFQEKYGF